MAQNDAKIQGLRAFHTFNCQGKPTLKIIFQVLFKLQIIDIIVDTQYCIANENSKILYDTNQEGDEIETMNKAIHIIESQCKKILINKSSFDQNNIDEGLLNIFNQNEGYLNITLPVSFGLISLNSKLFYQPAYQYIRKLSGFVKQSDSKKNYPSLMINLLQGSKVVGVKCKGEAALKYHTDGTFICTVDTITDNLKQIEEAINKTPYKSQVCLGLSMMADNLYNQEKKLYELENPKQLLDLNQLIDYYLKLSKDKPIIEYLEDPIISDDHDGWALIIQKFQNTGVKIGSRLLYKTINEIKQLSNPLTNEDLPDISPEELEFKNQNRVHLDIQQINPYEFPTLTKFLELTKFLNQKKPQCAIIISENISDTNDTTIVDLAELQ
ncbi:hypothetical protein PPERSA_09422 [Pseudocohnilembus persalinus]|uniref:phosphopyruvate hydratase n=1 Tax=Pseudocohnilembus persalinus TaxID=266149 RepID=A0A0V0Q9N7_PSEPJ|nr:hypothetical protein PPERSA_09422 [Pseudocohnilembus persalinus]|eukprot:KRW98897.1 hypothetical protein PPERSA_09422 [Pseudocohnilembus persalinus]